MPDELSPDAPPPSDVDTTEADDAAALAEGAEAAESTEGAEGAEGADVVEGAEKRRGWRPVLGHARTVLAALLVFAALVVPGTISHPTPLVLARIPMEGLLVAAVLLVLPARPRRVLAVLVGVGLALLTILKIVDVGYYLTLDRPFDLLLDWAELDSAMGVVADSLGKAGAVGLLIGLSLLLVALLVVMSRSVLRLTGLVVRHRTTSLRATAGLAVVWAICAALGAQFVPALPIAARTDAALVYHRAVGVYNGLTDERRFADQLAVDPYRDTPGSELLTGLQGKDVVFTFVESYGRSAITEPEYAPQVNAVLDAGTRRLQAAGFASRSGFLTSSTAGGYSWLAHASTFAGLWVNNQKRYDTLVASDRLTLPAIFRRAGWRTVSAEPAITTAWPEKDFYGYDRGYAQRDLRYRGPRFSYSPMPDQYLFSVIERAEHGPRQRGPLMAEITLTSSHGPWTPIPRLVDWDDVGDGSIFRDPATRMGGPAGSVVLDRTRLRAAYRQSIEYSLSTVISYVEKYGDDDMVLVFLGDHQPGPVITGPNASRDVPITIVTRDRAVLDRTSEWAWHDGLRPGPRAPVWPMDTFRDRFLTTFGR